MQARVFISYSHRDADFAGKLITALRRPNGSHGLTFWSDRGIEPGESWKDHLQDVTRRTGAVIAIMSRAALDSAHVMMGLGTAHAAETPVIPVIPPRRSVNVSPYLPHAAPTRGGLRPVDAVVRDVLDQIEELVSNRATA